MRYIFFSLQYATANILFAIRAKIGHIPTQIEFTLQCMSKDDLRKK